MRWLEKEPLKELGDGEHQDENAALLLRRSVAQVSDDARLALGLAGTLAFAPIAYWHLTALLEDDERRSRNALNELVNYGLLERQEERWQVSHALIHIYARTELPLSREALQRRAHSYIRFSQVLSIIGTKGYAELDGEREHYLCLMERCLANRLWDEVKALAGTIREYLDRQGYWKDHLDTLNMRLIAARQTGNRRDEAWCLNNLGYSYTQRGENEQALDHLKQSLSIYCEQGDQQGQGTTLNNIAVICYKQGKYRQSMLYYAQTLNIWWKIGDRKMEAATLSNMATLASDQGDYITALKYYGKSLPIAREMGDRHGESITLANIANVYYKQGNSTKSLEHLKQALEICREQGNRAGEMGACWGIGFTYQGIDELTKAEEYISQAVQIAEAIEHPETERFREELKQVRAKRQGMQDV